MPASGARRVPTRTTFCESAWSCQPPAQPHAGGPKPGRAWLPCLVTGLCEALKRVRRPSAAPRSKLAAASRQRVCAHTGALGSARGPTRWRCASSLSSESSSRPTTSSSAFDASACTRSRPGLASPLSAPATATSAAAAPAPRQRLQPGAVAISSPHFRILRQLQVSKAHRDTGAGSGCHLDADDRRGTARGGRHWGVRVTSEVDGQVRQMYCTMPALATGAC